MPHWRRAPLALVTGVGLVVSGAACTDGEPAGEGAQSPSPLPTSFDTELPPGVNGEPVRYLHGPGSESPKIFDDSGGVRIEDLGDAFLISSNSEERHMLQRAGDGETLWQGDQRIDSFGRDRDGSEVLVLAEEDGEAVTTEVVDDEGETVWAGSGRKTYLDGLVVRRPKGWSAEEPYGDYAVLDTAEEEIWDFTFEEPPEDTDEGESEDEGEGDASEEGAETDPDPERMGVPVGARGDVLFLDDGSGLLQARDLGDDTGELLWSISGNDEELAGESAVPRPEPQLVGTYELPGGEDGATGEADADGTRETVLVRWTLPEDSSLLSLHDLESGELQWTLTEPGANPDDHDFGSAWIPGTVYDSATQTLLLPQASGATPMIGVDLVEGGIGWQFEGGTERAITPTLALDGFIYGDSRESDDGTSQVVLEAESKDIVSDDLAPYVEAVTGDGHALVVWERQRFVFAPAVEAQEESESSSPTG
ncbi:hypothetical protein F4561_005024 [Lipingzhangella halophila]|uniref:PQQ-like domain-containing protein n=1 Tax=Lipingzhangella halophila TaxID=1783352 RepID=A0A7W7RLJ5_9ACTN|nr:hypothetical protein [Lipingzhangella halophila]MBB4934204.1 hypothetical protein [Lipingzhangella halophila]